jgi:hypothetical protein
VGSDFYGEATGDLFGWSLALSSDDQCIVIGDRGIGDKLIVRPTN